MNLKNRIVIGAASVAVGALAISACWYWYREFRTPTNVAYVTEEDGKIDRIDLTSMKVVQSVEPQDISPRGEGVTFDGKFLITANKDSSDIAVFDTRNLKLLLTKHIGDSPEFIKLDPTGQRVFATFEPGSKGGPPKETAGGKDDDDADEAPAQIATFHVGDWTPGPTSTAGKETEGLEFSPDGKLLLVANEAQDSIGVFDANSGSHIRDIDLKPYGRRPRGIKVSPNHDFYSITMESSGTLLKLSPAFEVLKSVPTAAKPYGESFDSSGKRIFVSAAMARKLQVFDADSLNLLAEVPIGQRCWHFTFTPDGSKILMACGRSNNILIVDPSRYQVIGSIEGFHLPWGIITYPRSYGSLGLP